MARKNDSVVNDLVRSATRGKERLTPAQFFELAQAYEARTEAAIYVYRVWPRINRQLTNPDNPNHILLLPLDQEPNFDLKRLGEVAGRGKYKLHLMDSARVGHSDVAHAYVEVNDPTLEPWIEDIGEVLVNDRQNASYVATLKQRGMLGVGEKKPGDGGGAVETMADLVRSVVVEGRQKNSGPDPFDIAFRITEMTQGKGTDPSQMMNLFLAQMQAQQKAAQDQMAALMQQNTTLMTLLLTPKPEPPKPEPSEMSALKQVREIIELVETIRPNDNGPWGMLASALPELLRSGSQLATAFVAARSGTPIHMPPPAPASPVAEPAEEENDEMNELIGLAQNALEAFGRGVTGAEYAAALRISDPEAIAIILRFAPDQVKGLLTSPLVAGSIPAADRPKVVAFIDAFFEAAQSPVAVQVSRSAAKPK